MIIHIQCWLSSTKRVISHAGVIATPVFRHICGTCCSDNRELIGSMT